jgi:AcrR family transcriptional regulator
VSTEIDPPLVDATSRVLARAGLRGMSITAIAEEAGVSRVTLHRRGHRVTEYLIAALVRVSDDLRAALWPAMTGSGPAADRLDAALRQLCDVAERHRGVMTAVYDAPVQPLPDDPRRTTSFGFVEPFERLLRDGQLDGSLVCGDPFADATLLANAVCWTYLHMRAAHDWAPADTADRVVALCLARFRPPTS